MTNDVETHRDGYISIEKAEDKTACSQIQPRRPRSPKDLRDRRLWMAPSRAMRPRWHHGLEAHSWAFIPSWLSPSPDRSRDSANVLTHSWSVNQRRSEMKDRLTGVGCGSLRLQICLSFVPKCPLTIFWKAYISSHFRK